MVSVEKWTMWDSAVEVDVTEGAASPAARALTAAVVADTEAVCDLGRGAAEIHAVNLAQGTPVKVTHRMGDLLRSALWAARMTNGVVNPLADNFSEDESIPPIHAAVTFEDVQLDGDVVFAPWGASFDIAGIAKANTVDRAARSVAATLQCGAAVRIGDVIATAGHAPAGGWQMSVPAGGAARLSGGGVVELVNGTAMATAREPAGSSWAPRSDRSSGQWVQVSVIAADAVWAYAAAEAARLSGGLEWLEQQRLRARLVDRFGRVHTTGDWFTPQAR
ncbi:thiamine biosynthesis lipoprotein [Rhodococcus sp. 27YEA15]|uniref:FAD:protein FMN transferase n=1 Tax=Rhodococcus sp. 27YEA15 TaxID=3156259 RepID=UPI003C79C022